ncbi:MAG: DegT/DnrJ/EryC1/StrS family aminotransferase [Planctomycetales bacterium]|nr:DegT/DnrJ/EryC1/StrS family aminotransferase [Planctomycetales bacterium]
MPNALVLLPAISHPSRRIAMPITLPPLPWPLEDPAIAEAARAAIADGSWGQYEGRHGERLRQQIRERWSASHVTLCCSGTMAMELALRGLRVQAGEVILAAYDFPGNFRAVESVGASPVLVDVEPGRYTLNPQHLDAAFSPQTQALIVSHLHGELAPMSQLRQWADAHGVPMVEDVCQSPGAASDGRLAGQWGDVATLSFGGSKLLTAGRGGAVLTSREEVSQRILVYSERGNNAFPLSELQAAVLAPQLDQLDAMNERRRLGIAQLRRLLNERSGPELLLDDSHGAVFRAAWRQPARDEEVARLSAAGAPVGAGFRGFGRRSSRRCRKPVDLSESAIAAESTLLLHHRALLADESYLTILADLMAAR